VRTHPRKVGEIGLRVLLHGAKTCFCYQCNAAFRPLILHRFRPFLKQQMWIAFRMRTPVKNFPISAQGFSRSQNSPKCGTVEYGVCDRAAAQTAQLWTMGIISEASRHHKDVPFVREFCWGTYGLGAIQAHEKAQILVTSLPELNCRRK